jgi:hypothetical protein
LWYHVGPIYVISRKNNQFLTENFPYLITEEEKESWLRTALKVIDPTGVLSYGDLSRAYNNYVQDQNVINFTLLLIGIFNALPNLGLLAFGVGGVGWAGVKASLKVASRNPGLIKSAGEKMLAFASKTPMVKTAFGRAVDRGVSSGIIKSKTVANNLKKAINTGVLPSNTRQIRGMTSAAGDVGALGGRLMSSAVEAGTLAKRQAISRLLGTFGPSGVGSTYPGWAPKSVLPQGWDEKVKNWFSINEPCVRGFKVLGYC